MTHPLTDETCDELVPFPLESHHDYQEMRAAADWQLERDVEFFKRILVDALSFSPTTAVSMAQEFKKAMRPQEDNS